MSSRKTPSRVNGVVRSKFGLAPVLAQSEVAANAFGRPLGFIIMMTALLVSAFVAVGTMLVVLQAFGRF